VSAAAADPTRRFSNRVANYVKFRPSYPPELLPFLGEAVGLTPNWVVADVGSGTGISSELLLKAGHEVYAIEPNADMRGAAERQLGPYPKFHSLGGTAIDSGLPDASVDLVTAFQSFHWFDPIEAKREFRRILRPGGAIAIVWNDRLTDATPFLRTYEQLLLKHGTDYQRVRHSNVSPEVLERFFQPEGYHLRVLTNEQVFDFDGVLGRLLSSSYAPAEGDGGFEPMLNDLRAIFREFSVDGRVRFLYETRVYYGRIGVVVG
jgi:SAM-dependent methyltransferase